MIVLPFPYSFGEADHRLNQVENKDVSDLLLALTWLTETAGKTGNKRWWLVALTPDMSTGEK